MLKTGKSASKGAAKQASAAEASHSSGAAQASGAAQQPGEASATVASSGLTTEFDVFKSALDEVDALSQMTAGMTLQYSSKVSPVNDSTAEYVVSTVKHFYDQIIIVQYGIKNTLDDQVLSTVTLKIENFTTESGLAVKGIIPLAEGDSIRVADQKFIYLVLDRAAC